MNGLGRVAVTLLALLLLNGLLSQADDGSGAPMEEREKKALYSAIETFVGKGWNGSGLYPDPCGWSPIQGVSCDLYDGLWYPTVISIGPVLDNSLECAPDAKFSSDLFELKHLKSLSFYNCFTTYHPTTIPITNWEKLAGSLETLEFRSNTGLSGPIPSTLGQLSSLQSLVLVENNLTGVLPIELGGLTNLRRLVLSGNGLSGQIPPSLGNNLTKLLILDLSSNALTGSLPYSLGSLSSLLKMDLSNNYLHESIPADLAKLKILTLLDLRNNSFTGGLAQFMQGMVSLQDLLLSNNPLGGSLMPFGWEKLANLCTLDLSNLGLVGSIPDSITGLRELRFLALDHNYLTGSVPPKLAELPDLSALYLNGNNLTGRLEFSGKFYERMGRRFASWNNPNLCFSGVAVDKGKVLPFGVDQCKDEQEASVGLRSSVDSGKPDESSSLMGSFGSSKITGFWNLVLVQELVAGFLLLMLL